MPILRFKLPGFIQNRVDQHYLDVSLSRLLPLASLIVFGVLVGLVFNTGVGHPYDKVIHVGFYALLTLSIHTLFCCRLRISAVVAFVMGLVGEGVQAFVPHHQASLSDAVANGIGVAMVVAAIALIRSEEKQVIRSQPVELDLEGMGLEPFQSDSSSGRSSEK
ncbi:antibiotic resistance protein VanZ [Labrenzia sp. CE80]|uniref:antibiotic resistance protein VanZ n=1 Tax=Labrenzia sp. CE80 TaxID=1788986 RepID=UPI00129AD824|nr:antibiotic resistance protein VanZ [Labrenzia sp. CE80]